MVKKERGKLTSQLYNTSIDCLQTCNKLHGLSLYSESKQVSFYICIKIYVSKKAAFKIFDLYWVKRSESEAGSVCLYSVVLYNLQTAYSFSHNISITII